MIDNQEFVFREPGKDRALIDAPQNLSNGVVTTVKFSASLTVELR
jgi:hypothetical protein